MHFLLFSASLLLLKRLCVFVNNGLALVSQLLVALDGLHEDESPLFEVLSLLVGDSDHFGLGIVLVSNFEVSLALVERALANTTVAQVCDESGVDGVTILLVLEYRVTDLGVAGHPGGFAFYLNLALDLLTLHLCKR